LPAQLARKLNVPDKHQARMIIDSAIRNCLIELSELPDRITQEHYKDFIETENGKKTPKSSPKRKAA
jgi:hypothetical protein